MKQSNGFSLLETLLFIILLTLGISIFQQTLLQLFKISTNERKNRQQIFLLHANQWINSCPKSSLKTGPIQIPCPEKPPCHICKDWAVEIHFTVEATGADWYFRGSAKNIYSSPVEPWIGPFRISFYR